MFSKTDGPTALRADLVRALSFSHSRIERQRNGTTVSSLAALAAVWNGRKGHVAVLLRDIEPPAIERYVGSGPITSESELDAFVEEGLAFAESLGFSMDAPDYEILSIEERDARIYRWNKLRKLRSTSSPVTVDEAPSVPNLDAPDLAQVPTGYEIELEDLAVPSPPPSPEFAAEILNRPPTGDAGIDSGSRMQNAPSAVLGRISLVRKGDVEARRLELLARLLAFY